jgi:hypothetical protein
MREINASHRLGAFPKASHDSWQFHFFSRKLNRFFSIRYWASNSVRQAWAWTANATSSETSDCEQSMIAHIDDCEFIQTSENCTKAIGPVTGLSFTFEETSNISHSGILSVKQNGLDILSIRFLPKSTQFWQVPGQTEGVFHFPYLSADLTFEGKTEHAFGYCKRYWGNYDGPWGYQFIQGIAESESASVWTADATFGDDEYNYFKIFNCADDSIQAAERIDTYHNNQRAFWRPLEGPKMEARLTECAKHEFHLKSNNMFSKLVERFGKVELFRDGELVFTGHGFNEICFGTVA